MISDRDVTRDRRLLRDCVTGMEDIAVSQVTPGANILEFL